MEWAQRSRMTDEEKPEKPAEAAEQNGRQIGWLKVGAVAAASAVAGGLAAVWYYRKTLAQLREAELHAPPERHETDESDFDI